MGIDKVIQRYIPMTETMFYILLCLQEESHGYAITQKVTALTKGRMTIGAGTMYQSLGKLHGDKLIEMTEIVDRQKRYRITDIGKQILILEAKRISELYHNVEALL